MSFWSSNILWWICPLVFVCLDEVLLDLRRNSHKLILKNWILLVLIQIILHTLKFGQLRLHVLVLSNIWELESILVEFFGIDLKFLKIWALVFQGLFHLDGVLDVLLVERSAEHLHFVFDLFYFLWHYSLCKVLLDILGTVLVNVLFSFTLLCLSVVMINDLFTDEAVVPAISHFTLNLS